MRTKTLQMCTWAQEDGASGGGALDDVIFPELTDMCTEGSCYPATGDLLIGRAQQLKSTSTCGLNRPEPFCIVSHLQEEKKCFVCDSGVTYDELTSHTNSHRIENVVTTFAPNRLKTWWQSENGLENVTIQLNLEAEFHFTHLIMTFKTFRPAAMVIERSADFGKTWQVYRYFAYDCETSFPLVSHGPMQKVDDVICDSRYSDIEPSTEGEVIYRVLDPAFRIEDPYSPKIQNLLKITNLRVKFTKLHTLGDNLLDSRMEIKEKYYYAIYDMVVRGNCFCYGHASECAPVEGRGQSREGMPTAMMAACTCSTLGTSPGGNPCESETGSCFCKRLVTGHNCDQCVSEHWGLSNDMDGCRPCDCDLGGAIDNRCDQVNGQCVCKDHMFGRRCDQVESGFYFIALDHYTYEAENAKFGPGVMVVPRPHPYDHSPTWTGTGLVNVPEGAYLEFSVDNIPHSMEYDIVIRYEPQLPDQWEEVLMTVLRPGPIKADSRCVNTVPDEDNQMISLHPSSRYVVLPRPVCFESGLNYTIRLSLPLYSALSNVHSPYTLIDSIVLMPHCKNLEMFTASAGGETSRNNAWETFQRYRCLENSRSVVKSPMTDICRNFIFSISALLHQGAKECQCDPQGSLSTVCDPSGGQCQCRPNVVGRNCDRCAPATFQFGPSGCRACACHPEGSQSPFCNQLTGQCICVPGAYGQQCDRCLPGHWGFPSCRPCSCNGHADSCEADTGHCIACRDHTTGYSCDRCLKGYYGDPVLGSGDHCRPCLCPDGPESLRQFAGSCYHSDDSEQVVCVCNAGYKGARCDRCSPGYHGNPAVAGGQCLQCQCNNNIDMLDPESCDARTGECLRCLYHSEGAACQHCKLGYYGNALVQDCRKCVCNQLGSDPSSCLSPTNCHCDRSSGQCHCRPNVTGQHCDRCAPDTWNMASGLGCQHCQCDPKHSYGSSCNEVSASFTETCDCDPRGVSEQQCNKVSGHCVCTEGVSGPRCDICARGFSGTFPDCHRCHQCFAEWDNVIGQLTNQTHRLVNKVNAIKASGVNGLYRRSIQSMEKSAADLQVILDQNPASQPLSEIQNLLQQASDLMAALTLTLNNTEETLVVADKQDSAVKTKMDSMTSDAQKLERTIKELLDQVEFIKNSDIRGATDSVTKYLQLSQAAEARANASTIDTGSPVETSAALRHLTEDKLNQTTEEFLKRHSEHAQKLDTLAGELQTLDLSVIRHKTCGSPILGQNSCWSSSCGGLGCVDSEGQSRCGGEGCDGAVSTASSVLMKAQKSEQEIVSAMAEVEKLAKMVSEVKRQADQAKLSAGNVLMKTNRTKHKVNQSNEELRSLIRQIKDFLTQDAADPESIELVANEVLSMQMPTTPAHLQNLTEEIRQRVGELGHIENILQQSADDIQRAEVLLDRASRARKDASDVKDSAERVKQALEEAQRAQATASSAIQQATTNIQTTNHLLSSVQSQTADAELKLHNATQRLQRLEQDVLLLRDKSVNVTLSSNLTNQDAANIEQITKDLKQVPEEYLGLKEVFNKVKATSLPPHRSYDCPIDLVPGSTPPKGALYSLSTPEQEAMQEYIKTSLQAGIIRPSISPAGTGFFFVGRKDGSLRPCID
ncbi:laminin subunit beta-1 [Nematolebias whitei]|uniref:laminin subunit beta-1 n=1 Tax=Nematolebias whitei TaxID=451745 RepID=UPI001899DD93|nr:laminin subunit beta-1 [Nematolebias whitei]